MSNYEWERGTFKLPSAEFAGFRQAVQEYDRARKEKVFALTQRFWKGLTRREQTDVAAYRDALSRYVYGHYSNGSASSVPDPLTEDVYAKLLVFDTKPRRVLASDMDYPTNRSTVFRDGEATVSFDKDAKTVTWDVDENNHAVDSAHETELWRVFSDRMGKVRWTHGTGGSMAYHSEYDDDYEVGGGANTCSGAYGYLGIAENPHHVRPFVNAKGQNIGVDVKFSRYGTVVGKPVVMDRFGRPIRKPASRPAGGGAPGRGKTTAKSTPGSFAPTQRGEGSDVRL